MSTKLYTFTVEGSGQFPYDMLRYDQCWPKTEANDSIWIDANPNTDRFYEPRQITLVSIKTIPTRARWESFGWRVINREEKG